MLNSSQNGMPNSSLCIWGPTQSGKTSYLSGLILAMRMGKAKNWTLLPENQEARTFMKNNVGDIAEGKFPRATDRMNTYTFGLQQRGAGWGLGGRYHELTVVDPPGRWTHERNLSAQETRQREIYHQVLQSSAGIVLMIDPQTTGGAGRNQSIHVQDGSYLRMLEDFLYIMTEGGLAEGGRINLPLSICVTKVDMRDDLWKLRERPYDLLKKVVGGSAFNILCTNCQNWRAFSISVVGRHNGRSNLVDDGALHIKNIEHWEPYQIMSPLFWAFDQIEMNYQRTQFGWLRGGIRNILRKTTQSESSKRITKNKKDWCR